MDQFMTKEMVAATLEISSKTKDAGVGQGHGGGFVSN
jgi:SRSO17 transposase